MYLRNRTYYCDFKTADGKRINQSLGTGDYKAAKQKEDLLKAKYNTVKFDDAIEQVNEDLGAEDSLLFLANEHFINDWQYKASGTESLEKMRRIAKIWNNPLINEISYMQIESLKQTLQRTYGLQRSTVNRYLHALSAVFRHASDKGVLLVRPKIKTYKETDNRIKVFTEKEEAAILKAADSDLRDLIIVLLQTGARLSEALRISVQDCNFKQKILHLWKTKNGKARSVPMTDAVYEILKRRTTDSDQPFQITIDQVEHAWKRVRRQLKKTDDKEFVIHALRHTCASRLVGNGINLLIIKEILGHSSIKITEKYAHLNPDHLKSAMETLN